VRTAIIQMLRFGRSYRVKMGCGCVFHATFDEARRDQLFIGKSMTCVECGEERA
jgi:hypothetical protein